MQKLLPFIILFLLITSCNNRQTEPEGQAVAIDIPSLPTIEIDTGITNQRQRLIKQELDYYLQRHKVDDDGFDMVARYAENKDSMLAIYAPQGHTDLLGMLPLSHYKRNGIGLLRNTYGHIYIGVWKADTLYRGFRLDSTGVYAGRTDHSLTADGYGCYLHYDGSYYEGHWQADKREGLGFYVSTKNLQAGTWRAGRFHGERMRHTGDRIYGIDISRYQHEKGRRRFGINWNDLRVTHLGRRIKDNITGEVDYPVRFVFIKSTQGITIRNRYYATDYAAARKKGLAVGSYHFFSTRYHGRQQAKYFYQSTLFRKGDLPPVLDIEPSDAQIRKMGGTAVLLREVRAWLNYIEKSVGVRPILYVNQRFINEHLVQAPDLMENYLVWIARYGEYKPGLHLAFWQLSADAHVKGIATDVDVNVFNGYEPQWEEFIQEEAIKR